MRYEVRVKRSDSAVWQRGIYLREPLHGSQPMSFTVEVLPKLHEVRLACLVLRPARVDLLLGFKFWMLQPLKVCKTSHCPQ